MKKQAILADLFLTLAKVGLFTFGGGYAMISVIEENCVEKKKWITHDELMEMTVIAESTPGPIAINCATYVGYKTAGFLGAVIATFGMILPSFVVIYCISMFLEHILEYGPVANAFRGIQVAVGLLILDAGFKMMKKMKKKPLGIIILATALGIMLAVNFLGLKLSSVVLMVTAGIVSLAVFAVKKGGSHR